MALTRIKTDQILDGTITGSDIASGTDIASNNLTLTGDLQGPAIFTIDPAAIGDNTGTVVIAGDLQVDGATTTINSSTLTVDDKQIVIASGATDNTSADGAGILIDGANATITYDGTNDRFEINKDVQIIGGSISGTDVDVSGATFTVANDQISGDAINGGTATPTGLDVDSGTLFVDSANNRVGVGTSSPDADLEIEGETIRVKNENGYSRFYGFPSSGSREVRIQNAWGNGGKISFVQGGIETASFAGNGDISFYEDTGTTPKFFWDASAERLGIGTSSPEAGLHVKNRSLVLERDSGTSGQNSKWIFDQSSALPNGDFEENSLFLEVQGNNGGFGVFSDSADGTKNFFIKSDGKFGIGTTDPQEKLVLSESNPHLVFEATAGTGANHHIFSGGSNGQNFHISCAQTGTGGGNLIFETSNSSEAARIDSSGNLLVGATSDSILDLGARLKSNGIVSATRNGGNPLFVNRLGSDGEIVDIRKDGSTIGSIGVDSFDLVIGKADTGVKFERSGPDRISPFAVDTNSVRDGGISLGGVDDRFKDLYLSGGVYLGGTGSANKLDDYEEGAWTPVLTDGTATKTLRTGLYTKIGDTVHISFNADGQSGFDLVNQGFGSSHVYITGVPFSARQQYSYAAPFAIRINDQANQVLVLFNRNDNTRIDIINFNENNSDDFSANVSGSSLSTSGSQYYALSLTYKTNS
jgi:hypothetical protein